MVERYQVPGSQLVEKVKQLIHEGNIRHIRIVHKGNTILEIPLSIGAPAAAALVLAAPLLAALGTIEVERIDKKGKAPPENENKNPGG